MMRPNFGEGEIVSLNPAKALYIILIARDKNAEVWKTIDPIDRLITKFDDRVGGDYLELILAENFGYFRQSPHNRMFKDDIAGIPETIWRDVAEAHKKVRGEMLNIKNTASAPDPRHLSEAIVDWDNALRAAFNLAFLGNARRAEVVLCYAIAYDAFRIGKFRSKRNDFNLEMGDQDMVTHGGMFGHIELSFPEFLCNQEVRYPGYIRKLFGKLEYGEYGEKVIALLMEKLEAWKKKLAKQLASQGGVQYIDLEMLEDHYHLLLRAPWTLTDLHDQPLMSQIKFEFLGRWVREGEEDVAHDRYVGPDLFPDSRPPHPNGFRIQADRATAVFEHCTMWHWGRYFGLAFKAKVLSWEDVKKELWKAQMGLRRLDLGVVPEPNTRNDPDLTEYLRDYQNRLVDLDAHIEFRDPFLSQGFQKVLERASLATVGNDNTRIFSTGNAISEILRGFGEGLKSKKATELYQSALMMKALTNYLGDGEAGRADIEREAPFNPVTERDDWKSWKRTKMAARQVLYATLHGHFWQGPKEKDPMRFADAMTVTGDNESNRLAKLAHQITIGEVRESSVSPDEEYKMAMTRLFKANVEGRDLSEGPRRPERPRRDERGGRREGTGFLCKLRRALFGGREAHEESIYEGLAD